MQVWIASSEEVTWWASSTLKMAGSPGSAKQTCLASCAISAYRARPNSLSTGRVLNRWAEASSLAVGSRTLEVPMTTARASRSIGGSFGSKIAAARLPAVSGSEKTSIRSAISAASGSSQPRARWRWQGAHRVDGVGAQVAGLDDLGDGAALDVGGADVQQGGQQALHHGAGEAGVHGPQRVQRRGRVGAVDLGLGALQARGEGEPLPGRGVVRGDHPAASVDGVAADLLLRHRLAGSDVGDDGEAGAEVLLGVAEQVEEQRRLQGDEMLRPSRMPASEPRSWVVIGAALA